MKRPSLGNLLLASWLIIYGLVTLFHLGFPLQAIIMGVLALAAGILILIGR